MLNKEIKETREAIEFFGGKDFEEKTKDMEFGEIIADEGLFIAWGKSLRLQTLKEIQEKIDKKVEELKKILEDNDNKVGRDRKIDRIFGDQDEKATK